MHRAAPGWLSDPDGWDQKLRHDLRPEFVALKGSARLLRGLDWQGHGFGDATIVHAVANAVVIVDLEPDADPPKVLAVGPDPAGNLLEAIWIDLEVGVELVIHAMRRRPAFYALLPKPEEDQA